MPAGRHSDYSTIIADEICINIATSNRSMASICAELGLNVRTVLRWLSEKPEFQQKYARAKEQQADFLAEELLEIADDSSKDLAGKDDYGNPIENKEFVNRSKLRVDARKWVASKLKPKKYGDKLDLTSAGEKISNPIDLSKLPTELLQQLLDAPLRPDSEAEHIEG